MKERKSVSELEPYVVNPVVCNIKLDANEGSKDLFKDTLKEIIDDLNLNLYPDDNYKALKKAISFYTGCNEEDITVGNGSSELLDLCIKTFVEKDELILSLAPTFSMYSIYAKVFDTRYYGASVEDDFKINVDKIIEAIKENNPKLTIICNPNNPTGTEIKREDIIKIVKSTNELVIVDEAYMEFGEQSVVDEVKKFDNLLVVKTMSKAFSMAGIRTGYLIANQEIIKILEKVRAPYNLNSVSALLAEKALYKKDKMLKHVEKVKSEREKIYKSLLKMGIKAYSSGANFVFFYSEIENLAEKLISNDILIRKFGGALNNYYRVTVGTEDENKIFLENIKKYTK